MVKTLSVSEQELMEELDRWERSVTRALEGDERLKSIVYEEIRSVVRFADPWSNMSFDDYAEMLSNVANKVRSYVRERHGIELENCYTEIEALPKWAGYFKQEIEKNKPLSSVRLSVKCIIPLPKKFEELEGVTPLSLEISAPLFFVYSKYKGVWHVPWASPPQEARDIRVEVTPT
jgi:lysyl-tRNA synthetase class II